MQGNHEMSQGQEIGVGTSDFLSSSRITGISQVIPRMKSYLTGAMISSSAEYELLILMHRQPRICPVTDLTAIVGSESKVKNTLVFFTKSFGGKSSLSTTVD